MKRIFKLADEGHPWAIGMVITLLINLAAFVFSFILPISYGFYYWLNDKGQQISCYLFDPDFMICKTMERESK